MTQNTLFVVGNPNTQTVKLVAECLKKEYPNGFDTIVLFESPKIKPQTAAQFQIYQNCFGVGFTQEIVPLNEDGSIPFHKLFDTFSKHSKIALDLTNGQKSTTSMLYMAALLCGVEDIYDLRSRPSLLVKSNETQETAHMYLKMPLMSEFEPLSSIGNFDLIYYLKLFHVLFSTTLEQTSSNINALRDGLKTGVSDYFSGSNYTSVIQNVTRGNEEVVKKMEAYIFSDCLSYCRELGVDPKAGKDPIGKLNYFFRQYASKCSSSKIATLNALCPVPGLLSALRDYRNIAAHNAVNLVRLTQDDARAVINMEFNALKCLKRNPALWNSML